MGTKESKRGRQKSRRGYKMTRVNVRIKKEPSNHNEQLKVQGWQVKQRQSLPLHIKNKDDRDTHSGLV